MRWRQLHLRGAVHLISRLRRQLPLIGEASGVSGKLHKGRCTAANLQLRHSIFFCFSKRKRCSSETASTERVAARRDVSYPLSPLPPLQIANATLVCNLRPGGISISPRSPLEPTKKTASVFLDLSRDNKNSVEIRQTVKPMRIRTALQILNAERFYCNNLNAPTCKSGVP